MTKNFTKEFDEISKRVARKATAAADNLEKNSKKIFKNGKTKLV
jgi:hypothetical protein